MSLIAPPIVLSVAGSDPSGGAGLQADLKTFHQFGVYGAAAVTLITVQNTQAVQRVEVLQPDLVREQIIAVTNDLPVSVLKIGALGSADNVAMVADLIHELKLPAVVDPVMISKHGASLLPASAQAVMRDRLLPRAYLVTPNLPEAEALIGESVAGKNGLEMAARRLQALGCPNVLVKGGHADGDPIDTLLSSDGQLHRLVGCRIVTRHTHGTGCTLAAATAAGLALGLDLYPAVQHAHSFVQQAIANAPGFGHGNGPLNHFIKISA